MDRSSTIWSILTARAALLYFWPLPALSTEDKITWFAHLNETDYPEWVIHMEATLIWLGLWEVVMYEGDLDGSEEDVKKLRESWLKKHTVMDNQSPPIISVIIDYLFLLPELMQTNWAKLMAKFQHDSSSCP